MNVNSSCCWPFSLCCYQPQPNLATTSSQREQSAPETPELRRDLEHDPADGSHTLPEGHSRNASLVPKAELSEKFETQLISPEHFRSPHLFQSAIEQQQRVALRGQSSGLEKHLEYDPVDGSPPSPDNHCRSSTSSHKFEAQFTSPVYFKRPPLNQSAIEQRQSSVLPRQSFDLEPDHKARSISVSVQRTNSPHRFDAQFISPVDFRRSPSPQSAMEQQKPSALPGQSCDLEDEVESIRQRLINHLTGRSPNDGIKITNLAHSVIRATFPEGYTHYYNTKIKQIVPNPYEENKVET